MISDFFMENFYYRTIQTPISFLELKSDRFALLSVSFTNNSTQGSSNFQPAVLREAAFQLREYFEGKRKIFNIELNPEGTTFQKKVWSRVSLIPYGEILSYKEVALQLGSKNITRAVGMANSKNPIPIIIPCHRVIGSNKKLTGYAGGIDKKRWLLQHELHHFNHSYQLF